MESKAKKLLRTLRRVGIHEVTDLKKRLESYIRFHDPASLSKDAKEAPTLSDPVGFLESIGLWEIARHIRIGIMAKLAKQQGRRRATRKAARKAPAPEKANGNAAAKKHYLVRALHKLLIPDDANTDIVQSLRLNRFTADEEALASLAARSRQIVPALAELRSQAADRSVLQALVQEAVDEKDAASDGESSACEFAVDSSSGEEYDDDAPKKPRAPLVLPAGWYVQRLPQGSTVRREFVDPSGKVYTSEQQARRAIDVVLRATNVESRRMDMVAKMNARLAMQEKLAKERAIADAKAKASEEERRKQLAAMRAEDPKADMLLESESESESDSEETADESKLETTEESPNRKAAAIVIGKRASVCDAPKVDMDARTAAGESPEAESLTCSEPASPNGFCNAKVVAAVVQPEPAREAEPDVEAIIDDVFAGWD